MANVNKTTLSVEFPILEQFNDYHEIPFFADSLGKLFGKRIGNEEVGYCEDGEYWGIFYVGRKPGKKAIAQLMTAAGFKDAYGDEDDDEDDDEE